MVAGVPGFWFPALSNILISGGLGELKETAFMIPSIAGILSPLVFAAQVDQRFEAQKVLGWIMLSGSVFLFLAFHSIEAGWGGLSLSCSLCDQCAHQCAGVVALEYRGSREP